MFSSPESNRAGNYLPETLPGSSSLAWTESRVQAQPGTPCPIIPSAQCYSTSQGFSQGNSYFPGSCLKKGSQSGRVGQGDKAAALKERLFVVNIFHLHREICCSGCVWQTRCDRPEEASTQVHLFLAQCTANFCLEARAHFPDHI